MLILSRKKGQNIMIYNDEKLLAEVTITAICGNKVKLGFTAPKEITIDREEVFKSKRVDAAVMKRAVAHRVKTKQKGREA